MLAQPVTIFSIILLAWLGGPGSAAPSCLRYSDELVVTGRLDRREYPGPPNYESIATGDSIEAGFYLRLPRPICLRPGPSDDAQADPLVAPLDSVMDVQVILDSAGYAEFRPFLNRTVTVAGHAIAAHTGHHHAPLLLEAARIVRPGSPGERQE